MVLTPESDEGHLVRTCDCTECLVGDGVPALTFDGGRLARTYDCTEYSRRTVRIPLSLKMIGRLCQLGEASGDASIVLVVGR